MGPLEITGTARLLLGLATGIAFGFILQKGQVTRYDKIVAFFRLTDLAVLKVMFEGILAVVFIFGSLLFWLDRRGL